MLGAVSRAPCLSIALLNLARSRAGLQAGTQWAVAACPNGDKGLGWACGEGGGGPGRPDVHAPCPLAPPPSPATLLAPWGPASPKALSSQGVPTSQRVSPPMAPSANPTQVSRWTHGGKSVTVLLQRSGKRRWLASCCITDVGHCGPVSSELGTTVPDSSRLTVHWAQVAAILTRPSTLPPAHFPSRRSPVYIFLVSSR